MKIQKVFWLTMAIAGLALSGCGQSGSGENDAIQLQNDDGKADQAGIPVVFNFEAKDPDVDRISGVMFFFDCEEMLGCDVLLNLEAIVERPSSLTEMVPTQIQVDFRNELTPNDVLKYDISLGPVGEKVSIGYRGKPQGTYQVIIRPRFWDTRLSLFTVKTTAKWGAVGFNAEICEGICVPNAKHNPCTQEVLDNISGCVNTEMSVYHKQLEEALDFCTGLVQQSEMMNKFCSNTDNRSEWCTIVTNEWNEQVIDEEKTLGYLSDMMIDCKEKIKEKP